MSLNVLKLSSEQFLAKLAQEIQFIENHLSEKIDQENASLFAYYQSIYKKIQSEIESKTLRNAVEIYGQFLQTIKRFKRKVDNAAKFFERDIDSFRKRYEHTSKPLLPLIHDIKMNVLDRMTKFDINMLKEANFSMHLYTNKELCEIVFKVMDWQGTYKSQTTFTPDQIKSLIKTICLKYNVVPYHNFTHAFSVFQMLFCMYENSPTVKEYIQPFEFMCAQIAALGHDLNHKGMGNLYKQKRQAQQSLIHCELGVLENMHASQLFQILQGIGEDSNSFNYFNALKDQSKVQTLKRIFVSSILATDMGKHAKATAKLKKRVNATIKVKNYLKQQQLLLPSSSSAGINIENQSQSELNTQASSSVYIQQSKIDDKHEQAITDLDKSNAFDKDNPEDRRVNNEQNKLLNQETMQNEILQMQMEQFSLIINNLSAKRTIKEEKYNLPVTGFLIYKDKLTFLNGQTFFCKSIVLPFWNDIASLFPELRIYPDEIEQNLKELEVRKETFKIKLSGIV